MTLRRDMPGQTLSSKMRRQKRTDADAERPDPRRRASVPAEPAVCALLSASAAAAHAFFRLPLVLRWGAACA